MSHGDLKSLKTLSAIDNSADASYLSASVFQSLNWHSVIDGRMSPKSVLGVPGSREQGEHKLYAVSTFRLRLRRFNLDFLDEFLTFF